MKEQYILDIKNLNRFTVIAGDNDKLKMEIYSQLIKQNEDDFTCCRVNTDYPLKLIDDILSNQKKSIFSFMPNCVDTLFCKLRDNPFYDSVYIAYNPEMDLSLRSRRIMVKSLVATANSGIKVVIFTHCHTVIRELGNLTDLFEFRKIPIDKIPTKRLKDLNEFYDYKDCIKPDNVSCFLTENDMLINTDLDFNSYFHLQHIDEFDVGLFMDLYK